MGGKSSHGRGKELLIRLPLPGRSDVLQADHAFQLAAQKNADIKHGGDAQGLQIADDHFLCPLILPGVFNAEAGFLPDGLEITGAIRGPDGLTGAVLAGVRPIQGQAAQRVSVCRKTPQADPGHPDGRGRSFGQPLHGLVLIPAGDALIKGQTGDLGPLRRHPAFAGQSHGLLIRDVLVRTTQHNINLGQQGRQQDRSHSSA